MRKVYQHRFRDNTTTIYEFTESDLSRWESKNQISWINPNKGHRQFIARMSGVFVRELPNHPNHFINSNWVDDQLMLALGKFSSSNNTFTWF